MILAMILAASTATITLADKQAETAYIVGRCDRWIDAETRADIQASFDEIDPRLWSLYIDGLRDGRKEPLARSVCVKMINDLREEMKHAS